MLKISVDIHRSGISADYPCLEILWQSTTDDVVQSNFQNPPLEAAVFEKALEKHEKALKSGKKRTRRNMERFVPHIT